MITYTLGEGEGEGEEGRGEGGREGGRGRGKGGGGGERGPLFSYPGHAVVFQFLLSPLILVVSLG